MKYNRYKYIFLFFCLFLTAFWARGQEIIGYSARWDDRLDEWEIYYVNDDEVETGIAEHTFALSKENTDWTIVLDTFRAQLQTKFSDTRQWELSSSDLSITIRQQWLRDNNEWVITNDKERFLLRTTYSGHGDQWVFLHDDVEILYFYTKYENDIRDWVVEDYYEGNLAEKLAAIQLALWVVSPRQ